MRQFTEKEKLQMFELAVKKWGTSLQEDMIIEECSELIKAILKRRRTQFRMQRIIEDMNLFKIDYELFERELNHLSNVLSEELKKLGEQTVDVHDELADVEIMLGQGKLITEFPMYILDDKLMRLHDRLGNPEFVC